MRRNTRAGALVGTLSASFPRPPCAASPDATGEEGRELGHSDWKHLETSYHKIENGSGKNGKKASNWAGSDCSYCCIKML